MPPNVPDVRGQMGVRTVLPKAPTWRGAQLLGNSKSTRQSSVPLFRDSWPEAFILGRESSADRWAGAELVRNLMPGLPSCHVAGYAERIQDPFLLPRVGNVMLGNPEQVSISSRKKEG